MKFLCLAYGSEEGWNALTKGEQDALLAQDEMIRGKGALMAAVETNVTTVRAWDGRPLVASGSAATGPAPLAGFSIIEADTLDEVVALVKDTPCARARGVIEIHPITTINDDAWRHRC